jgi:hypothetical protein
LKLIAKDFASKTDLLDAVLGIRGKFIETPTIVFVGLPEIALGNHIQQIRFKLLPDDSMLDIPQLPSIILEKLFCWTHVEAHISNDEGNLGMPWISEVSLNNVMITWAKLESMLVECGTDFEDYFFKTNTEKKSSYTMTRDELMLLLSLHGMQTLRQVLLSKQTNPVQLVEMIFNSEKHRLLTKSHFDLSIDYAASIKAMGERVNLLIKNIIAYQSSLKQTVSNQLVHDLTLLTQKYPDTECIGISGNAIDVSETVSSLMLTKDIQYTNNVGSSILKPLNILLASICCNLAWTLGIENANELLLKTDKEIADKYKNQKSDKKISFLRSADV